MNSVFLYSVQILKLILQNKLLSVEKFVISCQAGPGFLFFLIRHYIQQNIDDYCTERQQNHDDFQVISKNRNFQND